MKCELCHKSEAQTAIQVTDKSGAENELYVCRECARRERVRRQQQSQHTRRMKGLPPGVSMSVTQIGGDPDAEPPPFVEALMNAFNGMVGEMGRAAEEKPARPEPDFRELPCDHVDSPFHLGSRLHLEGLHLLGELDAVKRAIRAMGLKLTGVEADGVKDAGHVYAIGYVGSSELAKRVVEDLLTQECFARVRVLEDLPRVMGDSLCRALAILKNCRLLSPGELFDLLSPLRLAALRQLLDGITLAEIEQLAMAQPLDSAEDKYDPDERDRVDAVRADEMNERFRDVVLAESAEERFL